MEIKDKTIALLIDADNISRKYLEVLVDELNKFGDITYKRIYGDFTSTHMRSWRELLLDFALEPIQQFNIVGKKNVTDAAMIIDAMDILYSGTVDAFCIATSDSDFTKLAVRIKNQKKTVIGAGNHTTSNAFRTACHRFLLMDTLIEQTSKGMAFTSSASDEILSSMAKVAKPTKKTKSITASKEATANNKNVAAVNGKAIATDKKSTTINKKQQDNTLETTLKSLKQQLVKNAKKILNEQGDSDGGMWFSAFMSALYKCDNTFNPKNYGQESRLIPFFKNFEINGEKLFIIDTRNSASERIRLADFK
ncbi:MAG: NYN domain-containing protein [Christensenellaceae bacterium]|nr:NYN domain-containing protein [Christensenellaceae bacterium]